MNIVGIYRDSLRAQTDKVSRYQKEETNLSDFGPLFMLYSSIQLGRLIVKQDYISLQPLTKECCFFSPDVPPDSPCAFERHHNISYLIYFA